VTGTEGGQNQQLIGSGVVSRADGSVLPGVRYRLELCVDGTVNGTISAPPSERLTVPTGMLDGLLLKMAGGRLIAFEVRVYESRPGGSARIAGRLLRAAVEVASPIAA
jgi:hypothetical protein